MKGISAALKVDSPVILVTGCSGGGIGHSLCLEFAARGCRVFATSRKLGTMESLLQQPGIATLELDVTVQGSIEAAVASVLSQAGRIDILVSCKKRVGTQARVPDCQTIEVGLFGSASIPLSCSCV